MIISVGRSKNETSWQPKEVSWEELVKRLSKTQTTSETVAEYQAMSKEDKARCKDVGGFVGGEFNGSARKNQNLRSRSLLALDIDFGEASTWDDVRDVCAMYDWECLMHTTHSHTNEKPRYRLFMPLNRTVGAVEYEAVARQVAGIINIELFDDTTFEPARLMFWPSTPRDGEFRAEEFEGSPIDVDEMLGQYEDWKDQAEWPCSSRKKREIHQSAAKQEDPRKKGGIVGAFCRVYDIPAAIETYLPDVYLPTENPDRWTYAQGSTVGGMVVYDDGVFCYSHHDTDPASGMMCNAFDLVGVHKFPGKDSRERFEAMKTLCAKDEAVRHMLDDIAAENATKTFRVGMDDPLERYERDLTEQGNALALTDGYKDVMRWTPSLDWCIWDGEVWQTNSPELAIIKVMNQADRINEDALKALQLAPKPPEKSRKADWPEEYVNALELVKWAKISRNYANMTHTLSAAKALMLEKDDSFDCDPWQLNTPGGVIDLRTGDKIPHRSEYMCTMETTVTPDWELAHPMWDGFLDGVTGGDKDYAEYLQTVAGMACVGKVYEEGLVIAYGEGSNGKSTMFDTWVNLLGSYALVVRNEIITGNRMGTEVAGQNLLRGKRLVTTGELEESQVMLGSTLKRLTSHDAIQANVKYHEPITFVPSHTLVMHTNHLPRLRSVDTGTARRIAVAPFTMKIPADRKITDFGDLLIQQEGPAILAWMCDGARKFWENGRKLKIPEVVKKATADYIGGEDIVQRFINEACTTNEGDKCGARELFQAFLSWVQDNGMHWNKGDKVFKEEVVLKGFQQERKKSGLIWERLCPTDSRFSDEI